jgi:chromosome segregation ATPase
MNDASRGDAESSRGGRYDFDRLERSVEFLIEEHQRLTHEREALLAELADREHRISSLESRLESESGRRVRAVEGLDRILSRLEELQAGVVAASENGR